MTRLREPERAKAVRRLLRGIAAGLDAQHLSITVHDLHPKNNTFPGEVFLEIGAESLDLAGATRENPVDYEGMLKKFLPECEFRGREKAKVRFAVLASAALSGGLQADLLDEVIWWRTDDFWWYALCAAVALARSCADRQGITLAEHAGVLAERYGVSID